MPDAENDALREWASAMSEWLNANPGHDLTAEDVVGNALARVSVLARTEDRLFTADEVIEIANETSDSLGNLYRLDFIDRIRHEASAIPPRQETTPATCWRSECRNACYYPDVCSERRVTPPEQRPPAW